MIPTIIGAGFSGQAYSSGDIDGIFGGAPDTYVRDLQWKVRGRKYFSLVPTGVVA